MENKNFYCDLIGKKLESENNILTIVAAWIPINSFDIKVIAVSYDGTMCALLLPDSNFKLLK